MPRMRVILMMSILFSATTVRAQGFSSIEIVPFGGYRWSSALSNVDQVSKFDAKDAGVFGAALDVNLSSDAALELHWCRFSADWEATRLSGGSNSGSFRRNDFQLGGVWYAATPGRLGRLYISASFGVGVFSSDEAETTGRLAWSVGAGVRRNLRRRIGLRADFRWAPAYVSEGSSFWCDTGDCYPLNSGKLFNQWEIGAGLIIEVGSR